MFQICAPSLIYLIFSATHIIIDTFKGLYNTALLKLIIAFMITLLLNALCQQGLDVISWIIVFVPFILMSVIVTMLLYIFGLDVATGYTTPYQETNKKTENSKKYTSPTVVVNPSPIVYYHSPSPYPSQGIYTQPSNRKQDIPPSNSYSSSPQYES